jgi:FkbM family methyltransferase
VNLHHVGGRSGTSSFPVLPPFERDFVRVLYDADVDCVPDAVSRTQEGGAQVHVLPYCLAAAAETADLYITYDPFNSSLRKANPAYHAHYSGANPDFDYVFAETTAVVERRRVQTVSLDSLVESALVLPPDFLSVDTEGTEFEILQGARRTLTSHVVGLVVEVEFHQLYEGQRLFGDVQQFLSSLGFDFVRFLHLGELSPYRAPIGLRGDGFQTGGDALFLRRLESVNDAGTPRVCTLRKLAFVAIVFGLFEFGIQCLAAAHDDRPAASELDAPPRRTYDRFLDELDQAMTRMPHVFPPTFATMFSAAESKVRCEADPARAEADSPLKAAVRRVPWIFGPLKAGRRGLKRARRGAGNALAAARADFPGRRYTDVEQVLMRYGLRAQAETLRTRRLAR